MGIVVCALILIISRMNTPADISDEEIISRARALGMVETGDLSLSAATEAGNTDAAEPSGTDESKPYPVVEDPEVVIPQIDDNGNEPINDNSAEVSTDTENGSAESGNSDMSGTGEDTSGQQTVQQPDTETDQQTETPVVQEPDQQVDEPVVTVPDETQVAEIPAASSEDYGVLTVVKGNSSNVVADKLEKLGLIDNARAFDKYLVDNGYATRISVGTFQIPYGSTYEFIAKTITRTA